MNYAPLIQVSLKHAFFRSGNCPDFTVCVNPKTAKLLRDHRCILKAKPNGLSVFAPTNNQVPLIAFNNTDHFVFDLMLRSSQFGLYSNQRIELSSPADTQLYQSGRVITDNTIDLTNPSQPFLSMDIRRNFNNATVTATTDELRFSPKSLVWVYFLVTDTGNSSSFSIEDANTGSAKTDWNRITPKADDKIQAQLAKQYPGKNVVCFQSKQAIICQESGNLLFRLKQDGHTLFEPLPNPSYQNFIQLPATNGQKPTDAIYQVVTYFPNSTLTKG